MISLAQWLFSKEGSLLLALVLNVIFSILAALSSRIIGKVMDAILILGFAGSILLVALLFLTPIQNIPSAYDAVWGAGAFQEVLTVAGNNGFTGLPPPSNDATIHMILFGVLAYVGFEASQYVGGEIRRPKRTSLYAILGALIVLIIYYVAFSTGVWRYPAEFLYAYQYNVNGGFVTQYKINIPLTLSFVAFFATSLTTTSALQFFILISIATIIGVGVGIGCIVFGTRQIFAMSFDRFFPSKFAEVSETFHMLGPYTIALAIVMTFAGSLSAYFNTFLAAINTIVLFAFAYMFTSIVAVVLPFVRRDIYERGLKLEIAGFPVITILGIVSLTTTLFILIMSAASLDLLSQTFTALFYGFGALIWVYYLWKNSKIGVSIETIFREIPPE
jgi:amino acid transporter